MLDPFHNANISRFAGRGGPRHVLLILTITFKKSHNTTLCGTDECADHKSKTNKKVIDIGLILLTAPDSLKYR